MEVLRTKSVEQSLEDADEPGRRLQRSLGPVQLTLIGIGIIIGTGIFVLTGEAAGTIAGPAIAISFVVAAVVCLLAGLCYAEFASVVPIAGSAYTFSYASLGELVAWIIGWDLILELALGAATVASGWSQYLQVVVTSARGTRIRRRGSSPTTTTSRRVVYFTYSRRHSGLARGERGAEPGAAASERERRRAVGGSTG